MAVINSTLNFDEHDLGRLLSLYGDGLLRICFMYLRDYHLAEDALQDTFERAVKSYVHFRGESEEKTWLTRIAINVCKNMLRSPWHRRRIDDTSFLTQLSMNHPSLEASDEELILAISRLSSKHKEVVLLFYYEEMKIKEIAAMMNMPEATVSSRLLRARAELKKTIKEWHYDE